MADESVKKPRPEQGPKQPSSVRALEKEIAQRRERLAATIDELAARTTPQALARSGADGVTRKVRSVTHTPEGDLRTERLAAVAGAVLAVAAVMVWLRRRR